MCLVVALRRHYEKKGVLAYLLESVRLDAGDMCGV
jgi:hypothetical protein